MGDRLLLGWLSLTIQSEGQSVVVGGGSICLLQLAVLVSRSGWVRSTGTDLWITVADVELTILSAASTLEVTASHIQYWC